MLGIEGSVSPAFNNNDFNASAFGSALQGIGTAAAGLLQASALGGGNNTPAPITRINTNPYALYLSIQHLLGGPINLKLPNILIMVQFRPAAERGQYDPPVVEDFSREMAVDSQRMVNAMAQR